MHSLLLVTIGLSAATTSQEARQKVFDMLMNDDSFCGEAGRFGGPLCDWFLIAGRWSGLLAEATIGPVYKDAVVAKFPDFGAARLPQSVIDGHAEQLDALWREHAGTGPSPYTRSGYDDFEDDAMVVTQTLYDALLAKHAGDIYVTEEFIDLDDEAVAPDFVGRKWLVVVDYHQ